MEKNYEIINHGFEHPDYFQGCGASFTEYDECLTGFGITEQAAFDDLLEQLAERGDCNDLILDIEAEQKLFGNLSTATKDTDCMYYMSVRFSL